MIKDLNKKTIMISGVGKGLGKNFLRKLYRKWSLL